jgi:hypothetical protein
VTMPATDSGVSRVEEALLAAMRGDQAGAAKLMFRLFTRDQALEGLNALVLTGAGALVIGSRMPGASEFGIEELAARAERRAPASEPVDLALFWEILQFVGSLAGGIRQPAEGLATRYSGERLLYGAFVVAQTLVDAVAERHDLEKERVMLASLEYAHGRALS